MGFSFSLKKPIGKYRHSYRYKQLWRSFSPITGETFCMTTKRVSKEFFIKYLEDFSKHKPRELKIIVIDNAGLHSTKDIVLPENIILMPIPPYSPELNPAEKVWQYMKDRIVMKLFDTLKNLENKIENILEQMGNDVVKSITGYELYLKHFYSVFNV